MNPAAPLQRYLAFGILVAIALVVALGVASIRRDVDNLEMISQDNVLWSATNARAARKPSTSCTSVSTSCGAASTS